MDTDYTNKFVCVQQKNLLGRTQNILYFGHMEKHTFAGRLAVLLDEQKISQYRLAELTKKMEGGEDCSQQLISYVLKKGSEISKYASHWAKLLNVETDWLTAGWEPKARQIKRALGDSEILLLDVWRDMPAENRNAWLLVGNQFVRNGEFIEIPSSPFEPLKKQKDTINN